MLHKMIRVLIADDSGVAREMVGKGVAVHRGERYIETEVVDDGAAALEVLRKKPIDIAFIDIHMPGLNGPQVISAMRDTQSNRCLTVAMSGDLDDRAETVLKKFGAYHFLKKPFQVHEVADIVATFRAMTRNYPLLVVDDSATMRKLTRKILDMSRFSFNISEAPSAEAALQMLGKSKFDLVLTDFHMPDIDGLELAGQLRDRSSNIGIYMMSTNDTTYLERSASFIGINGFLKKPFAAEDVDTIMHKFLGLDNPKFGKLRDMFSFMEREAKAS